MNIATVNFAAQPLDHLWHRIQHLDEMGGAFKDNISEIEPLCGSGYGVVVDVARRAARPSVMAIVLALCTRFRSGGAFEVVGQDTLDDCVYGRPDLVDVLERA